MSDSSRKPTDNYVPKAVVNRLSLYLRELQHLLRVGRETISSTQLGDRLGFTDAQVRKDLAYFGQFGHPGIGYRCDELIKQIKRILGTDRYWPIAIVGVGNLGRALLGYRGFHQQGFAVVAAFEADPSKIGQSIDGTPVYGIQQIEPIIREKGIRLGVVAVPANSAQAVAETLISAGIEGILNFAPVTINAPDSVRVVAVDLAVELEQLTFAVVNRTTNT
jgi:redox-sensing transcriptional repressor